MKKVTASVVALGVLATVACSLAVEVKSVNVVGFAKKSLPAGGIILTTCNFDPIGGGTNTILKVFGTDQLTQDGDLTKCDQITLWDPVAMKYQTWAQYVDGRIYKANDASEWESDDGLSDPPIPAGSGMWLKAGLGSPSKDIAFMGQVITVSTQEIQIVAGPQLIAYPYSTSIALTNTQFAANGATGSAGPDGDQVVVWDGTTYQVYALYNADSKWYKANDAAEWESSVQASNIFGMGDGFWYIAKGGFTWSEVNPYISNL